MATPLIRINQTGQPAGTPGVSRDNIVVGAELQVTDTANVGGTFSWTYVGPADSFATPTGLGTNDVRVTPDVVGTYLFFLVHDGIEYSYTVNAVGEWVSSQGAASVLLPDGRRIPGEGETDQFGGWQSAMEGAAKKIVRLKGSGITVPGGPFTELNFISIGGGQVLVSGTGSGAADVTISGGGSSASALQTTTADVDVAAATAPTVGQVLRATSPTTATWQDGGAATALATTGADVVVDTSAPPTAGQALVATSPTLAVWQDVATSSVANTSALGDYITVRLSTADQVDPVNTDSIVFNETIEQRGSLVLVGGDVTGLRAGRTYLLISQVRVIHTTGFFAQLEFWDATANARLGEVWTLRSPNLSDSNAAPSASTYIFTPLVDTTVQIRRQGGTASWDFRTGSGLQVIEIGAVQANIVGGLEYMDTIDVTVDVTSVQFGAGGSGVTKRPLDGEVDGGYFISYVLGDPGASTLLSLRPNSLDPAVVTDFYAAANYDGSGPVNPVYTSWTISSQASGYTEIGSLEIQDTQTGRNRGFTGTSTLINPASARYAGSYGGLWNNTVTPITTLQFLSDTASGIKAGSRFVLWRKTRQNVYANSAATYERNVETTVSGGSAAAVTFTTGSANFGGSAVGISATLIEDTVTGGNVTVDLKIANVVVLTAILNTTNTSFARKAAPAGTYLVKAGDLIEVDVTTNSLTTTSAGKPGLVINTTLVNNAFVQTTKVGGDYLYAALSADQTTNISEGNHIEFDLSSARGDSVTLATGAGQADGLFTLLGGKLYEVYAHLNALVNEGQLTVKWLDHSDDSTLNDILGVEMGQFLMMDQFGTDNVEIPTQTFLFQPVSDITIKLDVVASAAGPAAGGLQRWYSGSTRAWIKEVL